MKQIWKLLKTMTVLALSVAVAMTSVPVYANEVETENVLEVEAEVETEVETESEIEPESGILDTEAPVLKSITLDKTSVGKGGTIKVTMMAYDEISGLRDAEVFYSNDNGQMISAVLHPKDMATGEMTGEIKVQEFLQAGTFRPVTIYLYDIVGNMYSNTESDDIEMPDISFEVTGESTGNTGGEVDISDFSINNLTFGKTTLNGAESTEVTANVAGKFLYMNIRFYANTSEGYKQIEIPLSQQSEGVCKGVLGIPYDQASGDYTVYDITVYKENGYASIAHEDVDTGILAKGFTVRNTKTVDKVKPVFNSISFSDKAISIPGCIEIEIDATDAGSGLSAAAVTFVHTDAGNTRLHKTFTGMIEVDTDGKLRGKLMIPQYLISGAYELEAISVLDKADNALSVPITEGLKQKKFQIVNDATSDEVITSVYI